MKDEPSDVIKPAHWIWLAAIVVVGSWFRLNDLGVAALRADTIHFWSICRMPISGWEVFTRWTELGVGQMPLPLALTKWYVDIFGVSITEFHLRLPNALMGVALIPVMFFVGRRLSTVPTGLVAAGLLALNPFHIQLSMEAYFYASVVLGAGLLFLGALQAADAYDRRAEVGWWAIINSGLGFLLVAYSQVTGWVIAALLMLTTIMLLWLNRSAHGGGMKDLYRLTCTYAVVGMPLLFVSWGLPHMLEKLKDTSQVEFGQEVVELVGDNAFTLIHRAATSMAWGATWPRIALLALVLASGIAALLVCTRRSRALLFVPAVMVASYLMFLATRSAFGALYESRYLAGLLPIYLLILSLGIVDLQRWTGPKIAESRWLIPVQAIVLVLVVVALLGPAYAANQITGKPTPYKDIVEVVDRELSAGTPVLVDRWYEPWNEMKVYPSTNVVFTFTVPNEPLRAYRDYRWRDTAIQFFLRNPDAAYLELAKTYHDVPDIGPWDWPRHFFTRHISIRNEPGLRLRDWGVAARGDFYAANTNRVVVELFYNTREDVLNRLSEEGVELVALHDDGWRYVKSGPFPFLELQTEHLMEWRMMNVESHMSLINLTDVPVTAMLRVRGIALNGPKHILADGQYRKRFAPGVMEQWDIGPLTLPPGQTTIRLTDQQAGRADAVLLLERAELIKADSE